MKRYGHVVAVVAGLAGMAWAAEGDDTVRLTFVPSGAAAKAGGYTPQRVKLSGERPASVTEMPEVGSPLFGTISMGPAEAPMAVVVVVDEPEGKPARLYVDGNGNGDLTDDGDAEWKSELSTDGANLTAWSGGAMVKIPYGEKGPVLEARLGMHRFDKNDPSRIDARSVLMYYADYAYEGEMKIGETAYHALLVDEAAGGDFRGAEGDRSGVRLCVDVNGNGRIDSLGEKFDIRKTMTIKSAVYEVADMAPSGAEFRVAEGERKAAEPDKPADLRVGKAAPEFEARTTDGDKVKFPGTYAGKVVMLDFWATWCPPCRDEIPNVVAAYERYHGKGFEVLGVSLDGDGQRTVLAKFTQDNGMKWAQIYDGKKWKAKVAVQYGIDSIPRAILVDGDTGKILATGGSVRGPNLGPTVEKALAKKAEKK